MTFRSLIAVVVLTTFCSGCFSGNQNSAVSDLESAFQSGCSLTGSSLNLALSQTQSLITTIQDLRANNQCLGIDSALSGAQNMNALLLRMQADPTTLQMNGLQQTQTSLLSQIAGNTDPTSLSVLTSTYASNAVTVAELQGEEATISGSVLTTPVQQGYAAANGYMTGLQPITSSVVDCARDNPLFGAQMASQLVSVSGNFMSPEIGAALAVGGAVLSTLFSYLQDKQYSDAINDSNLTAMTTALSCGLESISDTYCQADDMMVITQLEECGYNPASSPNCPQQTTSTTAGSDVPTTTFWQGLDSLSRSLPALQIWVQKVVSGVDPADTYDSNRINDPKDARALLDHVNELAEGWENQETQLINSKTNPADMHLETVNALNALVSILAYGMKNGSGCQFGQGGCTPTPVLTYYPSMAAILYNIVGQPMSGCSGGIGGNCLDATTILLPGDTATPVLDSHGNPVIDPNTGKPEVTRVNGNGGWQTIIQNELAIYSSVYSLVDAQVHKALDVDPSGVLEAAKVAAGSGLPTPLDALSNLSGFLKASFDLYSNLPASLIEGGEPGRQGTLNFITSTKAMLDGITASVVTETGDKTKDEVTLKNIYNSLDLAQDPNFISERLTLHIQEDVKTRIKAGQIPHNAAEILVMIGSDPAMQLTAVPSSQIDNTMRSLGAAKSVSELNVQAFAQFFGKGLGQVLALLNSHADSEQEPRGGSPQTANFRSQQAQICLLIASTQSSWPSDVDVNLCKGTFYKSDLTGETLAFDDLYAKMTSGAPVKQRICSFYGLLKDSANFTHERSR